ncbi:MAG TPA: ribosomal protein S18-alanine N-acetyltransferase [Steroidobacteraceae bacterium]|nr:ribosomal protein S18-alanine N-acetyltransferase [Steroidobacteraceae bacterium]
MAVAQQDAIGAAPESIRNMQEADLPAVVRIEHASYAFPWTEGIFRDCLRVNYVCRVVESGAELIGYGIISVGAGEAHVLNICVAEEQRCRGVGRRLLTHLLQVAARQGARDALLETRPTNVAALHLYRSLGFVQVGTRRGYYQAAGGREDAVVLKRPVE